VFLGVSFGAFLGAPVWCAQAMRGIFTRLGVHPLPWRDQGYWQERRPNEPDT